MESGGLIEIIFLAMLAGFIALRLVSVLGRRTGHENPVGDPFTPQPRDMAQPRGTVVDLRPQATVELPADTRPEVRSALQAIAQADRSFEPRRFVDGARAAYGLILDAFWKGDLAALDALVADDVGLQFRRAIAARETDGITLENRLVSIDRAEIVSAQLAGSMAEITVRFDADIIAVSRDRDGRIVAGSTSDAIQTHDLWTFSRHIGAADPNWLLIATDEQG